MAVKVVKKPVEGSVSIVKNKVEQPPTHHKVEDVDVSRPTANVGFSAAYTKNLGNFESLKITVMLNMPVIVDMTPGATNAEVLDAAFLKVQSWVDQKVNDVLDEITK